MVPVVGRGAPCVRGAPARAAKCALFLDSGVFSPVYR